jgi:hypothetical protein
MAYPSKKLLVFLVDFHTDGPYLKPVAPEIRMFLETVLPDREALEGFLRENSDVDQATDQLELIRRALAYADKAKRTPRPKKAKGTSTKVVTKRPARIIDDGELLHTARTLALCSMPYEKTSESELVRKVTIDGSTVYVRFSAYDKTVPLPFGKDRALLTWVMSKALEQGHPRVAWDSATSILTSFQMTKGGRQLTELKESMARICNVIIGFGVMHSDSPEPGRDRGSKIIYEWSMPTKHEVDAEDRGERHLEPEPYYLEIEPKTYNQLLERPVSLPSRVLKNHINSPLTWDFLNFLGYQSTCTPAGEKKAIPLKQILTFLGTEDSNVPRLKAKLQGVIDDLDGFLGDVRLEGRGSSSFLFLEGRGKGLFVAPQLPSLGMDQGLQPSLLEGEITSEHQTSMPNHFGGTTPANRKP